PGLARAAAIRSLSLDLDVGCEASDRNETPRRKRRGVGVCSGRRWAGGGGSNPLEPRLRPLLVGHEILDGTDVDLRGSIPVTGEPSPYASPRVSSVVAISQPSLLALEAGAPDAVGVVDVECGALVRIRPGAGVSRWNVGTHRFE